MKTEIQTLTSCINMLLAARPVYPGTDLLTQIRYESERLKVLFHSSFNHAKDSFKLTETMNSRYRKLVQLANQLWERARSPNVIAQQALKVVLDLKNFLETEYGNFLDHSRALTNFERFKLERHVLTELTIINELMRSKEISEPLVLQLDKAFHDLFSETRSEVFNVLNKEYVDVLLGSLSLLAHDQRNKNWNVRLRQLLVKLNCNHMGIYKLLEAEHEHQILWVKDEEKQQDLLYKKKIWIEQIQPVSQIAYNRDASDLKSMLLKQIKALGPHLAKKHKLRKAEKPEKVKYRLSVDELSLAFHYHCVENIYDYPSKAAAAEAFCKHNRSIGTADISVNSFLKHDKLEQRAAAIKCYQRMARIMDQIKRDFDL